jgi:hypothetical protein
MLLVALVFCKKMRYSALLYKKILFLQSLGEAEFFYGILEFSFLPFSGIAKK